MPEGEPATEGGQVPEGEPATEGGQMPEGEPATEGGGEKKRMTTEAIPFSVG